jgi:phytoene dehydrogenase-like protein
VTRPPTSAIVVGAGVGGLVAACYLQRAGVATTVLERRHVGGCATTFELGGIAYDAGATLAFGLHEPGLLGGVLSDLEIDVAHRDAKVAWEVHGEGFAVKRYVNRDRWLQEGVRAFGSGFEPLWRQCEDVADVVLDAARRRPPVPPTRAADWLAVARSMPARRGASLAPLIARPFSTLLTRHGVDGGAGGAGGELRRFCDLQLLITAQAPAERAMALYSALALALPHRGTAVLEGGMGALAVALAERFRALGGELLEDAEAVAAEAGAVRLESGRRIAADVVVLNTTPWDAERLLGALSRRARRRRDGQQAAWGALCAYLSLPAQGLPAGGRYVQLEAPEGSPLGSRQSVFVSVGGAERDTADGLRPATVSVHAHRDEWPGRGGAYDAKKAACEAALRELLSPHLPEPARMIVATPATWTDFAGRDGGRVGGFPAVAGVPPPRPFPPRLARGLWLVGDSVMPGQSTMAVALAGRTIGIAAARGE